MIVNKYCDRAYVMSCYQILIFIWPLDEAIYVLYIAVYIKL